MDSTGSGDSHYGTVLRKQATELETALIAKSDLESQVRHLTSELQSHKTKLMQKEAEFKATESQVVATPPLHSHPPPPTSAKLTKTIDKTRGCN
jgi:Tfp pilus assembly protein FimV